MKYLISALFFLSFGVHCQKPIADLPGELAETSALLLIGDLFYSLNDSGNESILYLLDKEGAIQHRCTIKNAENYDWEALAYDGTHLYIGDIGNNKNNRQNLRIYKVNKDSVKSKSSTTAEIVNFQYEGQSAFPPAKKERYFDAEALVCKNDSLFIFTKNRTEPFDGVSCVYYVPMSSKDKVEAKHLYDLNLKPTNWMEESITDAHLCGEDLFILTYAKVYWYSWHNDDFELEKTYNFKGFTQKEGLTLDKKFFYLTDEDESITAGGNHLYKLRR